MRRQLRDLLEARECIVLTRAAAAPPVDIAVGVLGEQQPAERRVICVPGARPTRSPPGGGRGSARRRRGAAPRRAPRCCAAAGGRRIPRREADVDGAPAVLVVEVDGVALVGEAARFPQERAVDDRELESLAAVEGEHLHGVGIRVEAPGALVVGALAVGAVDPLAQPAGERGDAELLAPAAAPAAARRARGRSGAARRRPARAAGRRRSPSRIDSASVETPARAASAPSACSRWCSASSWDSLAAASCVAVQPSSGVSAAARARAGCEGCSSASAAPASRGRDGAKDAARAADHGRDPDAPRARPGSARRCDGCAPAPRRRPGRRAGTAERLSLLVAGLDRGASELSSATTSAARSRATNARADSAFGKPLAVRTTDGSLTSRAHAQRPFARGAVQAGALMAGAAETGGRRCRDARGGRGRRARRARRAAA